MDVVLETRELTKCYGSLKAVDGLDLEVRRGDVYGFLGPNGAGKSTTIRMLLGLVRPTSGSVALFGRDISRDIGALTNVGSLVETPAFYKYLSGWQNLAVLSRRPSKRAEIDAALEEVGLLERAGDKVKAYSHGMRQRLGLALAMLAEPELVILDEPTNGLDPQGMKEIRRIVRNLAEKQGATVFLSSHLLHEVEQVCDKVGIASHGRLVIQGDVQELMDSPGEVVIELDRPEEAADALQSLGFVESVVQIEDTLRVRVLDGRVADVNAFLVEQGFQVSALVPQRRTLEEIYLSVMEDEGVDFGTGVSRKNVSARGGFGTRVSRNNVRNRD